MQNFLIGVGQAIYNRKLMSQAFDYIESNPEMMTTQEKEYWDMNVDDIRAFAEFAKESLKNDPPPEDIVKRADKERERQAEEFNE